jgi:glycosyltransferase involved in cell wall biosynthesis
VTPDEGSPAPTLRVSVVIPVYNGASIVPRAVASLISQDYRLEEILLLNDGSTDATAERLRELGRLSPIIRVLEHEKNLGLSWTLNHGLRSVSGDLVLILHQDCALAGKDWMTRAVRWFQDPNVFSVVGQPLHPVGEMTSLEREFWVLRDHAMEKANTPGGELRHTLFSENKCDLFRRALLLDMGGFDPRLRDGGEDQVLAWKLRQTPFRLVRDPALQFSITLGIGPGLRGHLRKDMSYGRQMRQILRVTKFGALRHSPGASLDPRFVNRVTGVLWILTGLVGITLSLWTRAPLFLLLVGVPPLLRWLQLTVRGIQESRAYRLQPRNILVLGIHGLLADMAYAIGFLMPARRPEHTGESFPAS